MPHTQVNRKVQAEHGIVCSFPGDFYGYFGWPTVTVMDDGRLVVAASGLRNAHVCPFGRDVICFSTDEGRTWTAPAVVNDLPLDDRDAGIVSLGGKRLLLSWFSTDTRKAAVYEQYRETGSEERLRRYGAGFARMTDEAAARWVGSWIRTSDDVGETWGMPVRVPVTAPHGPIRLASGALLYLGKTFLTDRHGGRIRAGEIRAVTSDDDGVTWQQRGTVPLYRDTIEAQYHEPHVLELPGGKLIGLIRLQNAEDAPQLEGLGLVHFSLAQTESADRGETWTTAKPLGFHGSPPHLLRHSSGAVVCAYGYRQPPFGQRAAISLDGGVTWAYDHILRDDGPDHDLGYPSSVELGDGSILTVYYQKRHSPGEKCSLLWTRWTLPC